MKRVLYALMAGQLALLISACSSAGHVSSLRPEWIDNPGNGVSASAATHVRGRAAQEELAILRAREEYAKRYGVSIQSTQSLSTTVANDRASTVGSQVANEQTSQTGIKAKVKAKWLDPESDVLWVWLVPSDQ
jgi:hypothetical protein